MLREGGVTDLNTSGPPSGCLVSPSPCLSTGSARSWAVFPGTLGYGASTTGIALQVLHSPHHVESPQSCSHTQRPTCCSILGNLTMVCSARSPGARVLH